MISVKSQRIIQCLHQLCSDGPRYERYECCRSVWLTVSSQQEQQREKKGWVHFLKKKKADFFCRIWKRMIKHLLTQLTWCAFINWCLAAFFFFLIIHHLDAFLITSLLKSQVLICAQTQVSSAQRSFKMWLNKSYFNSCRTVSGAPTYGIWLQLVIQHIEPVIVEETGLLKVMGLDTRAPASSWIPTLIEYVCLPVWASSSIQFH